jgi:hypothetical protein
MLQCPVMGLEERLCKKLSTILYPLVERTVVHNMFFGVHSTGKSGGWVSRAARFRAGLKSKCSGAWFLRKFTARAAARKFNLDAFHLGHRELAIMLSPIIPQLNLPPLTHSQVMDNYDRLNRSRSSVPLIHRTAAACVSIARPRRHKRSGI